MRQGNRQTGSKAFPLVETITMTIEGLDNILRPELKHTPAQRRTLQKYFRGIHKLEL